MRVSSHFLATAVAVITLSSGAALFAQDRGNDRGRDQNTRDQNTSSSGATSERSGGGGHEGHMDKMLADKLLGMSMGEVKLAQFALQHSQNQEVKRFAEQMIQDHNDFNNKLARYASDELRNAAKESSNANNAGARGNANDNRGASGDRNATEDRSSKSDDRNAKSDNRSGSEGHGDMVKAGEDLGNSISQAITKELGQYQGPEFDRAYVGQQFWDHVVFIAAAQAVEKHVSDNDLKQLIQTGSQTAQQHLDHTRKLIRDLSANVARAGNTQENQPRR